MCLAIPALIKRVDGPLSDVDMGGIETRVSILLTPEAKAGDYVIVHAGFALRVMTASEAMETFQLLEMIAGEDEE
jgi:hydrogenase expression/formation protein HypC